MARVKPNNLYPIKDLTAANAALAEIAALKRGIDGIEAGMNEEIDRLKAETEAKVALFQTKLASIEGGLMAFAEHNKEELFPDKRSVELDFGVLGYRKSSEIKPKPKTTWAMVLGMLKDFNFIEAIRTKEDVDRDELRKWSNEKLTLVGAQRVEKDAFWYEVDQQKIADVAA